MDHKQYQKKILLELMKLEEFNEYFDPIQKATAQSQDEATIKKNISKTISPKHKIEIVNKEFTNFIIQACKN